jgi:peroxiredoxin Q/BCP
MRLSPPIVVACSVLALAACKKEAPSPENSPPAASTAAASAPAQTPARSGLLQEGDPAPNVEAIAHNGQQIQLAAQKGKPVVVYFYPKDDTPGCTVEAQQLRDSWAELRKAGALVLGVSSDDNVSHRAFASKHELPFLLLPDPDGKIAGAFGVPLNNGRAKRVTFLIDREGKVAKVFPEVTPDGHAKEILDAIAALES